MPLDSRFVIKIKNKDFVLLAGLLDLGHQNGLQAIETEVVEFLSRPDQERYVVRAIGTFTADAGPHCWSAYGDADPKNSAMSGAYLRHAETRAVCRMLRFACNVGLAAVEELGPDTEETGNGRAAAKPAVRARHDPQDHAERQPQPPQPHCSVAGCEEVLSPSVAALCQRRAGTLEGRLLCAPHLEAFAREYKARQAEEANA